MFKIIYGSLEISGLSYTYILFAQELKIFRDLLVAVLNAVSTVRFLNKPFSNSRAF